MNTSSLDSTSVVIRRPALNRLAFDELCEKYPQDQTPAKEKLSRACGEFCRFSGPCIGKKLLSLFPFINTVRTYKLKQYLLKDLIAGLSVGIIQIPQGMGFALLTAVAPVYGLYSSFFPVLVYFFFGTSRHISVGTMAVISIILGSVVEREAEYYLSQRHPNNETALELTEASPLVNVLDMTEWPRNSSGTLPDDMESELLLYKASIAAAVSLVSGGIMLLMGILKCGVITTFMPTSFLGGFTTGAAFHIVTSQVKTILGIKVNKFEGVLKIPYTWIDICSKLPTVSIPTLIVSLVSLILLISFKEFINEKLKKKIPLPIPIEMLVLVSGTVVSYFSDFGEKWSIQIVGPIPRGIPSPFMPPLERVSFFLADAIIIAILCFAISISMADIFARKHKYAIDTNQELIANGLCYGLSSFFYSFIGAAAPPRCFVQDSSGGKTQVASIFTALLLLLVLLAIGPLFQSLPNSVLSCIIVVALFPLFKQFKILPSLWRINKADFSIWIITWLASLILNLTYSLAVGIGWSVITVALTAMTASGYTLGVSNHQDLYAPVKIYKNLHVKPGVTIFKYESSLFFASILNFKEKLFKATVDPQSLNKVLTQNEPKQLDSKKEHASKNHHLETIDVYIEKAVNVTKAEECISNDNVQPSSYPNADLTPSPSDQGQGEVKLFAIILDCSAFAYVDFMGLGILKQLYTDYKNVGIKLILAECTNDLMEKLWADKQIGGEDGDEMLICPTITDALLALTQTSVPMAKQVTSL